MEYKNTLIMPKTNFQMRGNLGIRELEFQKRWKDMDLYNKVLEKNVDATPFILHDGPPYANGDIHIGHTLNKVLKDFVLRYQTMTGKYVPYIPGWDTHGLPIETALAKKGVKRKEISLVAYRVLCQKFAEEQVNRQKVQFQRLGILGDWDNPYITYEKEYESNQIKVFAKMVEKGLIYKGLKPVFWSPSSESALAEAEIEYHDKKSISVYVAFNIVKQEGFLKDASLLIWTTTPWTLPANLAVAVHPRFLYSVLKVGTKKYLVAQTLIEKLTQILKWEHYEVLATFKGQDLEFIKYKHPLYDRISPIICGDYVTDSDGTGLVHTAPGHGEDDYRIGKKYNLEVLCPVDGRGIMTEKAGQFAGMFYEKANDAIVEQLKEKDALLFESHFMHSYPHDWRTRKPVIFRATPQWFASIDKLKDKLLKQADKAQWIPVWGKVRIINMISNRDDWCISRQRAWGVPIPIFYSEDNQPILDKKLLDHISELFKKHGSNVWYEREATELLPKGYTHKMSPNNIFKKETDTMDVWFDSGTSHSILTKKGLSYPADLYLEGSDQYRGWFNSSLITGVAAYNQAPYKKVVSHGFVLDGKGRKMSKSFGNTVDPVKIMKQHGADLLRLWVATIDYQSDVRISQNVITQIAEGYRKIRNTIRFMLGNINGFNPKTDYISYSMRSKLNKVMTLKYYQIVKQVLSAYENYQFDKVYRVVVPFMTNELSAFYLDYTKDILYIENEKDFERVSIQSTIYDVVLGFLKLLTPIIPHTTSEAYQALPHKLKEDVFLEEMPGTGPEIDKELLEYFVIFEEVRQVVLKKLEEAREQKIIGKSLVAQIDLCVTQKQFDAIEKLEMTLNQVLIVSKVSISIGDNLEVIVSLANGETCERCWNVVEEELAKGLCRRCSKIIN